MEDELKILPKAQLPAQLDSLDDQVLHALAHRKGDQLALKRIMAFAAFLSLGSGILVGGAMPDPIAVVTVDPLPSLIPHSSLAYLGMAGAQ